LFSTILYLYTILVNTYFLVSGGIRTVHCNHTTFGCAVHLHHLSFGTTANTRAFVKIASSNKNDGLQSTVITKYVPGRAGGI
jgi:hypothetical protein